MLRCHSNDHSQHPKREQTQIRTPTTAQEGRWTAAKRRMLETPSVTPTTSDLHAPGRHHGQHVQGAALRWMSCAAGTITSSGVISS